MKISKVLLHFTHNRIVINVASDCKIEFFSDIILLMEFFDHFPINIIDIV